MWSFGRYFRGSGIGRWSVGRPCDLIIGRGSALAEDRKERRDGRLIDATAADYAKWRVYRLGTLTGGTIWDRSDGR